MSREGSILRKFTPEQASPLAIAGSVPGSIIVGCGRLKKCANCQKSAFGELWQCALAPGRLGDIVQLIVLAPRFTLLEAASPAANKPKPSNPIKGSSDAVWGRLP